MREFWELSHQSGGLEDFLKLREKMDELGCDIAKG